MFLISDHKMRSFTFYTLLDFGNLFVVKGFLLGQGVNSPKDCKNAFNENTGIASCTVHNYTTLITKTLWT